MKILHHLIGVTGTCAFATNKKNLLPLHKYLLGSYVSISTAPFFDMNMRQPDNCNVTRANSSSR